MIETIDDREFQKFQIVIHDSLTMKVKRIEFASKGGGQVFYAECKKGAPPSPTFFVFKERSYEKALVPYCHCPDKKISVLPIYLPFPAL